TGLGVMKWAGAAPTARPVAIDPQEIDAMGNASKNGSAPRRQLKPAEGRCSLYLQLGPSRYEVRGMSGGWLLVGPGGGRAQVSDRLPLFDGALRLHIVSLTKSGEVANDYAVVQLDPSPDFAADALRLFKLDAEGEPAGHYDVTADPAEGVTCECP